VHIAAIIASIDGRSDADAARLTDGLLASSWPGGCADRHSPSAAEWVRRWGPRPSGPDRPSGSAN